jgi:NTE family protein
VGGTLEYGGVADTAGDVWDEASVNGSLYLGYRTPIGPLYFGWGLAEGGRSRVFLRIGDPSGRSAGLGSGF